MSSVRLPAILLFGLAAGTLAQEGPGAAPVPQREATTDGSREQPAPLPALPSSQRFSGWSELRDESFTFDPDDRPVLGFSVHATPGARAALDEADAALRDGDAGRAARLYAAMVSANADEVLPVAGQPPRWVGAGEWALFQLLTRVSEGARQGIESPEQRRAVDAAVHWRDLSALRRLSWTLEGTGEGRRATALAARLLAESGAEAGARAAAERALLLQPDADLLRFRERLHVAQLEPPACDAELPVRLDPVWSSSLALARVADNNPFLPFPEPGEAPIAPIVPVVREGVIYVTDSLSISALDLYSGQRLWHFAGPLEQLGDSDASGRWFGLGIYVDSNRDRAVSPYQLASPAVSEALVVATVQVPEPRHELPRFDTIPIGWPLPWRRLVALDRQTGELRWSQERPELGAEDFVNTFNVAGPPAIADGVVYAAGSTSQGAINSYVAAFDLETGELLWRTLLCAGQQDLTMFNRPFQEHTASPPLVADGAVYACSNLGVVGCLDAWSGRIRWLSGYDATVRRPSRSPEHDQRRNVVWLNRPPLLTGGHLLVTPLDGAKLFAFEPGTGKTQWTLDSRDPVEQLRRHQMLGTDDGGVLLLSDSALERLDLEQGSIAWSQPLVGPEEDDYLTGMATVCGTRVLVPMQSALLVCDSERAGPIERQPWARRPYPVRMVQSADSVLLSTDNDSLFAAVDVERALDELQARAASSPEALLRFAELALSAGRTPEAAAGFDALLGGEPGAFHERAVAGRLRASLAQARQFDDAEHWTALLEVGERLGDVWSVAADALVALDALGSEAELDEWLGRLAALDAERRLDLGPLTPQGSQPAGLALALRRLPHDRPEQAVARLQELVVRWPDETWDGLRVHEQAARRIGELLDRHGRELYAAFDQQALRALAEASDEAAVAAVAERFPNAQVVEQARLQGYESLLVEGRGKALLEELAGATSAPRGAALAALRARAARQCGETALADALEGLDAADGSTAAAAAALAALPTLPGADAAVTTVEIVSGGVVRFPEVSGAADPRFATFALGTVSGTGELFALDTVAARVAWRRTMPGQVSYPTARDADFLRAGERLFVQVASVRTRPDRPAGDVLEAVALADGSTLWSRQLDGRQRNTLLAGGLVLRLALETQGGARQFRLDGFGQATGAHVLGLAVPSCQSARLHRAGRHVVVSTVGNVLNDGTPEDVRLWTLDLPAGELRPNAELPATSPWVVSGLDDPPCLLLAQRHAAPLTGTWLGGWDPVSGTMLWTAEAPTDAVDHRTLLAAGPSRALLVSGTEQPSGPERVQLLSFDSQAGLQNTVEVGVGLEPVAGQELGLVPQIVLLDNQDGSRLVVADGVTGQLRFELRLPPPAAGGAGRRSPLEELQVVQGRDGFLLGTLPIANALPTTLRIVDASDGRERYSVVLDATSQSGRSDLAAVEGAVLLAKAGSVRVIRSPTR